MEFSESLGTEDLGGVALDPLLIALDNLLVNLHLNSMFHSLPIRIVEPTEGKLGQVLKYLSSLFKCVLYPADVLGNVLAHRLKGMCPLSSSRVERLALFLFSRPIRAQYLVPLALAPQGQPTMVGCSLL